MSQWVDVKAAEKNLAILEKLIVEENYLLGKILSRAKISHYVNRTSQNLPP